MVRKLALLVGCNYSNNTKVPEENKLHGCINDVKAMQALIHHRFGFENITILTDEPGTKKAPTFLKIIDELNKLVDAVKPGDTLLFYFSGGGSKMGISAIIPCDLLPITGYDIQRCIIDRLPDEAIFTFICDSSYSGGLFDEKVQIESNVPDYVHNCNFKSKTIPSNLLQPINVSENLPAGISHKHVSENLPAGISRKHIILFSSSRANEESVEVHLNCHKSMAFSAYSCAIQELFNSPQAVNPTLAGSGLNAPYANREVAAFTGASLGSLGFDQHPYLNCSEHDAAAPFLGNVGLLGDLHVV